MAEDNWTQPKPLSEGVTLTQAERDWQSKIAEEDRQQQRSESKARRLMAGPLRGFARQDKDRPRGIPDDWLRIGSLALPCAALALLAPLISGAAGYYFLVLVTAGPVAVAAIALRPLERRGWLLRAVTPLLPLEVYFTLRYFAWDPGRTLLAAGLCAAAGFLFYLWRTRGKKRGAAAPNPPEEKREALPELEVRSKWQARRARIAQAREAKQARREKGADKEHGRRLLMLAAALTAFSLLVPAALGVGMQLYRPNPNIASEFDEQSLQDDEFMARRMNSAYEHLLGDKWGQASRAEKLAALQALLDIETDILLGSDHRFDLRDPAVLAATGGNEHSSVPSLLLTGSARAEQRVRAMCHLAYHLMQMTAFEDTDILRFEKAAEDYELSRYKRYAAQWANREVENDHAG